MTKREFLEIVFALAPNEANAIMDAFDEYVDSNEPHWIPCDERLPENWSDILITDGKAVMEAFYYNGRFGGTCVYRGDDDIQMTEASDVIAWMPLPEPYKGVTDGRD